MNHAVSESETIWAVEPCEHSIGPRDREERVRVPRAMSKTTATHARPTIMWIFAAAVCKTSLAWILVLHREGRNWGDPVLCKQRRSPTNIDL